jgi:hypothetical protein
LFYQQPGQFPGGILVADIDPGAQPVQVTPLGQQPGQRHGGVLVAGVGQAAQDLLGLVQVAALGGLSVRELPPAAI